MYPGEGSEGWWGGELSKVAVGEGFQKLRLYNTKYARQPARVVAYMQLN